jgi:hypothetical protein
MYIYIYTYRKREREQNCIVSLSEGATGGERERKC